MRFLVLLAALLLLPTGVPRAADAGRPHPHQGIVAPFSGEPPRIRLDAAQQASLVRGEAVLTSTEGDAGGRGIAIQDVHASTAAVWDRILDFADYPRMVDQLSESEIYHAKGEDVRVRMVLEVLGFRYEYFVRHRVHPERGYTTWTLDYSRESDLDDSVGYWAVIPHPEREDWSRVYYSIDMRTKGWMPGFLRSMVAGKGLRDATTWVKRESETTQRSWNDAATTD